MTIQVRELPGNVVTIEALLPPLPRGRKALQALRCLSGVATETGYLKALLRDEGPALAVELPASVAPPDLVTGLSEGLAAFTDIGSKELSNPGVWRDRQSVWSEGLDARIPALNASATKELVKKLLLSSGRPLEAEEENGVYTQFNIAGDMRVFVSISELQVGFMISPSLVWRLGKKQLKDEKYLSTLLRSNAEVAVARVGIDIDSVERYLYQAPVITPEVLEHAQIQLQAMFMHQAARASGFTLPEGI